MEIEADAQQAFSFGMQQGCGLYHSLICHYENGVPVMLEDRLVNMQVVPDYLQQDFTRITPNAYLSSIAPIVEGEHVIEAVNVTRAECVYPKLMNIRLVCWSIVGRGPAVRRRKSSPACARSIPVRVTVWKGACANDPSAPCRVVYGNATEKRHGRDARSGPLSGIGRI